MSLLHIAEIFGRPVEDHTQEAQSLREKKWCPFRENRCNKGKVANPLGICSFTDGQRLAAVCPVRFQESQHVFRDVGRLAFGPGAAIVAAPEVRILEVTGRRRDGTETKKRIGKVDFLIAKLDSNSQPVDFAALEVQAVYFSGQSIREAFGQALRTGKVPPNSGRRPDWRSSAQKRLMPQLMLKVPVFRRWGKKFFVAVDGLFFDALPSMQTVTSLTNSEVTWLAYPFHKNEAGQFPMASPKVVFTQWEDVQAALREGIAPEPAEILKTIHQKQISLDLPILTT